MIELELIRIMIRENMDGQIIVLKEKDGDRSFPIVIGINEAAAIRRYVAGESTPRPLTHDLLASVIKGLGGELERVVINDFHDSTYFARLIITRDGQTYDLDARPSDAIALASQLKKPIFVEEKVIDEVSKWEN